MSPITATQNAESARTGASTGGDGSGNLNTLETRPNSLTDAERMVHFVPGPHQRPKAGSVPKSFIDIALDSPFLTLNGTGPDVESTRLSGNVVLYLTEATSIREITLEFRGKAKIPVPASESVISSATSLTYSVCHHTWSFLDLGSGSKHVGYRTLKAGRHLFPFSLEIGGSLPSTISTPLCGGASVFYKLHALATRSHKVAFAFSPNLHHVTPITIVRGFSPTALEYQQTLEIENTWPGKLMYSILLPHKAWAQGDTLGALVKFSPTAKGVTVHSILTNIEERTKVYARSGAREEMRVVAAAKHEIVDGKRAVLVDTNRPSLWIGHASPPRTPPARVPTIHMSNGAGPSSRPMEATPPSEPATDYFAPAVEDPEAVDASTDIVSTLFLPIPNNPFAINPSHTLEPITISHRVRWSIYISNPDGHLSELRCSLPIVVLDGHLLREARAHTAMARRSVLTSGGLVAGAFGAGPSTAGGGGGDGNDEEGETLELEAEDRQLPSYHAHVRDRVANMYLPDSATMRVSNPWVLHGISPTAYVHPVMPSTDGTLPIGNLTHSPEATTDDGGERLYGTPGSSGSSHDPQDDVYLPRTASAPTLPVGQPRNPYVTPPATNPPSRHTRSGTTTPSEFRSPGSAMSHLPLTPAAGMSTPLDWINSELLLSLSDEPGRRFEREIEISRAGGAGSGAAGSRATSPGPGSGGRSHASSRPMSPVQPPSAGSSNGQHGHHHGRHSPHHHHTHNKHGLTGFLKGAMKGFGFTKHHSDHPNDPENRAPSSSSSSRPTSRPTSPVGSVRSRTHSHGAHTGGGFSIVPAIIPSSDMPSIPPPAVISGVPVTARQTGLHMTGPGSSRQALSRTGSNEHPNSQPAAARSPVPQTACSASFAGPSRPVSPTHDPVGHEALLHRAFTEVPDYSVAARGFLGGVAPLSSQVGLPSYDEVARERQRERSSATGGL